MSIDGDYCYLHKYGNIFLKKNRYNGLIPINPGTVRLVLCNSSDWNTFREYRYENYDGNLLISFY